MKNSIPLHYIGCIRMMQGIAFLFHFTYRNKNHFTWSTESNTTITAGMMKHENGNAGEAISYWIHFSKSHLVNNREEYETA